MTSLWESDINDRMMTFCTSDDHAYCLLIQPLCSRKFQLDLCRVKSQYMVANKTTGER